MIEDITRKDLIKQIRDLSDLPTIGSSGKSISKCYGVQARMAEGCGPQTIVGTKLGSFINRDTLTDSKWETLEFPSGSVGVPPSDFPSIDDYARHGYLSYKAAQALRWWFLADQGALHFIETRLVEYEYTSSYSAKPLRALCEMDSREGSYAPNK